MLQIIVVASFRVKNQEKRRERLFTARMNLVLVTICKMNQVQIELDESKIEDGKKVRIENKEESILEEVSYDFTCKLIWPFDRD